MADMPSISLRLRSCIPFKAMCVRVEIRIYCCNPLWDAITDVLFM
jgi:hypothetical protein